METGGIAKPPHFRRILILLGILYSLIIVGSAFNGNPSLLVGTIVALLFCLFVVFLRKKRLKEREAAYTQKNKPLFSIFDYILVYIVLFALVALPFLLGIFHWPFHWKK